MTLILSIFLFLFFTLIGSILLCLLGIEIRTLNNKNFLLLTPILGVLLTVCLEETLFIFFPIKYSSLIFLIIILISIFKYKKNILEIMKYWKTMKIYITIIMFSCFMVAIPSLKYFNLNSTQLMNNDIAYYLSSMDWIYNHNFLSSNGLLVQHLDQPFYIPALYMIKITRIGTDVLGATLMRILFLKPHQIFSVLGILFVGIAISTYGFLSSYILRFNKKANILILTILSFSNNWMELYRMQYIPQILGIAGLIAFFGLLLEFLKNHNKQNIILFSLILSGTLSVYSEFASTLFLFIVLILVFLLINDKKYFKTKFFKILKGCLLTFIISPLGMYKALKFNIMMIQSKGDSVGDPYSGVFIPFKIYIQNLIGFREFHNISQFTTRIEYILFILTIIIILVSIASVIFVVLRKFNSINMIFITILLYFIFINFYFLKIHYAYAQYKYLISLQTFIIFIIFFMFKQAIEIMSNSKNRFIFLILTINLTGIFIVLNLSSNNLQLLPEKEYFYYDKYLSEISKIAKTLPPDSVYKVSGSFNDIHASVYALKDQKVNIEGNSYFVKDNRIPFKVVYEKPKNPNKIDYELEFKSHQNDIIHYKKDLIWENKKYKITKFNNNEYIKVNLIEGFYDLEFNAFRWTSNQKSKIRITNNGNKVAKLKLTIVSNALEGMKKNINVYIKNEVIGKGSTSENLITNSIELQPKESKEIIIETKEKMSEIPGDMRKLGIRIESILVETLN